MWLWKLCQIFNGYLGCVKTAGSYIALQMLPFRWPPATGSADKQVVHIEGRAIFQGALTSAGIAFFLNLFLLTEKKKPLIEQELRPC